MGEYPRRRLLCEHSFDEQVCTVTIGDLVVLFVVEAYRERPIAIYERYATRFLRRIRNVLAPNGSSNKAAAIIVVGSGT